jgi:hypothetical protein
MNLKNEPERDGLDLIVGYGCQGTWSWASAARQSAWAL